MPLSDALGALAAENPLAGLWADNDVLSESSDDDAVADELVADMHNAFVMIDRSDCVEGGSGDNKLVMEDLPPVLAATFSAIDSDESGTVSETEFVAWASGCVERREKQKAGKGVAWWQKMHEDLKDHCQDPSVRAKIKKKLEQEVEQVTQMTVDVFDELNKTDPTRSWLDKESLTAIQGKGFQTFELIDLDKDGKVFQEEWSSYFLKELEKREQKKKGAGVRWLRTFMSTLQDRLHNFLEQNAERASKAAYVQRLLDRVEETFAFVQRHNVGHHGEGKDGFDQADFERIFPKHSDLFHRLEALSDTHDGLLDQEGWLLGIAAHRKVP